MSEIDKVLGAGSTPYVAPPFAKLCGSMAQIAYFVGSLERITNGATQFCLSDDIVTALAQSVDGCAAIAADELARALKEYDEAAK